MSKESRNSKLAHVRPLKRHAIELPQVFSQCEVQPHESSPVVRPKTPLLDRMLDHIIVHHVRQFGDVLG